MKIEANLNKRKNIRTQQENRKTVNFIFYPHIGKRMLKKSEVEFQNEQHY